VGVIRGFDPTIGATRFIMANRYRDWFNQYIWGFSDGLVAHDDLCRPGQICLVGDIHGDGLDDIVAIDYQMQLGSLFTVARVANNNGVWFEPAAIRWWGLGCYEEDQCTLADVDGDGDDDLVIIWPDGGGAVDVALSDGQSLSWASQWHPWMCPSGWRCKLADMDDNRMDDLVAFAPSGQALLALSNGQSFFFDGVLTNDACYPHEDCYVGRHHLPKLFAVDRGTGNVAGSLCYPELRRCMPTRYGSLADPGCTGAKGGVFHVDDFNGDGEDDFACFVRVGDPSWNVAAGDVFMTVGEPGDEFPLLTRRWNQNVCRAGETCLVGRFNWDRYPDAYVLNRDPDMPSVVIWPRTAEPSPWWN
jgi:hypothetical protein